MHAYRILLPSETDDSRFNSREKHMLTDSVQPYNIMIAGIPFVLAGQLKTNTPHYIHFF